MYYTSMYTFARNPPKSHCIAAYESLEASKATFFIPPPPPTDS